MAPGKRKGQVLECNINFDEGTGTLQVKLPAPAKLVCFCGTVRSTTKKTQRVNDMMLHLREKHQKEDKPEINMRLICECGHEEDNWRKMTHHTANICNARPSGERRGEHDPSPIYWNIEHDNNLLILPYPPRPNRCCKCNWTSDSAETASAQKAMKRHFKEKHDLDLACGWRCVRCSQELLMYHKNKHVCVGTDPEGNACPAQPPPDAHDSPPDSPRVRQTTPPPIHAQPPPDAHDSPLDPPRDWQTTPPPLPVERIENRTQNITGMLTPTNALSILSVNSSRSSGNRTSIRRLTEALRTTPLARSMACSPRAANSDPNNNNRASTEPRLEMSLSSTDGGLTRGDLEEEEGEPMTSEVEAPANGEPPIDATRPDDDDVDYEDARSTVTCRDGDADDDFEDLIDITVHQVARPTNPNTPESYLADTNARSAESPAQEVPHQRDWRTEFKELVDAGNQREFCRLLDQYQTSLRNAFNIKSDVKNQTKKAKNANELPSKARNQKRQLQRIRKKEKKEENEASKIQQLFNRYPSKAVRKVLGEQSADFTGDIEQASDWLKTSYDKPCPSEEAAAAAKKLFDECNWQTPDDEDLQFLDSPPTAKEIFWKLKNAKNTSPGSDKIEYIHLRKADKKGMVLEQIYAGIWRFGLPEEWKSANTILIHKKGDTSDISNFRPISLLTTLYKIFSGIISSRITDVAVKYNWISKEQKGFLPGIRGIQEHTQLLQILVDEAFRAKSRLSITWLDLRNAFGSIPHRFLFELFKSLPIPDSLRGLLVDIYTESTTKFMVGKTPVEVNLTTGVRQGDALSATVFLLAAEPLLRAAKKSNGAPILGTTAKATGYADDMSVITDHWKDQQPVLDDLCRVADVLHMEFNPAKCVNYTLEKGATVSSSLFINGIKLRCLKEDEREVYLGTPIGGRFLFRPHTDLVEKLAKLNASLLAPWQKLEVYRAYLIPSLAHHLASGKVMKSCLTDLDDECALFLKSVANVPPNATRDFLYADRRIGGLGMTKLTDDCDIWILARATQLLDSQDSVIRTLCRNQLIRTVADKLPGRRPDELPINEFLSGDTKSVLMSQARESRGRTNLWTRARRAAKYLKVWIDVSSDESVYTKLKTRLGRIADDNSIEEEFIVVESRKAVRGLRTAVRFRHSVKLMEKPSQGRVARALNMDPTSCRDITRMTAVRTELYFQDWHYIHAGRLGLLPLKGRPGAQGEDQLCRRCMKFKETTHHVVNGCPAGLVLARKRHDNVQSILTEALRKAGHEVGETQNELDPNLRPDIVVKTTNPPTIIDVAVSFDDEEAMCKRGEIKVEKYRHLGTVLPFIVGSFGAWWRENERIKFLLNSSEKAWLGVRRRCRLASVRGTTEMVIAHLREDDIDTRGNENPSQDGSS